MFRHGINSILKTETMDIFKIIDTFQIGDNLSVTFEGKCEQIKNGTKLTDNHGNLYMVVSVGTTRHNNPSDISKSTTVLISPSTLKKGDLLYIQ